MPLICDFIWGCHVEYKEDLICNLRWREWAIVAERALSGAVRGVLWFMSHIKSVTRRACRVCWWHTHEMARPECTKSHALATLVRRAGERRNLAHDKTMIHSFPRSGGALKFMGFRRRHFSNYYVDGAFSYFQCHIARESERATSEPGQYWRWCR